MPPAADFPSRRPVNPVAIRTDAGAFTLVELLVSMTVLALILVLTAQMVNQTMNVTASSNKRMDTDSMARIVLDRFGNDFATALLNNGATALYYTPMSGTDLNPEANSSIGFITESRARFFAGTTGSNLTGAALNITNDIRGVAVGYKIRALSFPYGSNNASVYIPVIQRGDARFTYSIADSGNNTAYEVNAIMGSKNAGGQDVKRIPNDILEVFPHSGTNESNDSTYLNYTGLGDGILRLHISFVLDDGRTVQSLQQGTAPNYTLNATYRNFPATGGTGLALPIAFSANTSADPNKRHVKGLIVGIAVLDEPTMRLAYQVDNGFAATLSTKLARPTKDGETPVNLWQTNLFKQNSSGVFNVPFLPLRQNLRFYQRFYPVSL